MATYNRPTKVFVELGYSQNRKNLRTAIVAVHRDCRFLDEYIQEAVEILKQHETAQVHITSAKVLGSDVTFIEESNTDETSVQQLQDSIC